MITKIIKPTKINIEKCALELKKGNIIAFPTETVYGLGANALNSKAVKKIFIAKGRPQDNPLIMHIADKNDINKYVLNVPKKAQLLIDKFWPGPLTVILKKKKIVPKEITAGLNSVAIRMPANKIALELISKSNFPLAAPSANSSGKPSPTKAKHVYDDLKGKIKYVIDGNDCDIGIESTVIDFTSRTPTILRPGKITKEMIEKIIGKINVTKTKTKKVKSPGMKYTHYKPKAEVILIKTRIAQKFVNDISKKNNVLFILNSKTSIKAKQILKYKTNEQLAKNIFAWFRDADSKKINIIVVEAVKEIALGKAIMNRLKKASNVIIE